MKVVNMIMALYFSKTSCHIFCLYERFSKKKKYVIQGFVLFFLLRKVIQIKGCEKTAERLSIVITFLLLLIKVPQCQIIFVLNSEMP